MTAERSVPQLRISSASDESVAIEAASSRTNGREALPQVELEGANLVGAELGGVARDGAEIRLGRAVAVVFDHHLTQSTVGSGDDENSARFRAFSRVFFSWC